MEFFHRCSLWTRSQTREAHMKQTFAPLGVPRHSALPYLRERNRNSQKTESDITVYSSAAGQIDIFGYAQRQCLAQIACPFLYITQVFVVKYM